MASAPWLPLYFWVFFFFILLWHHSLRSVRCWAGPDMYKHLTQELGFWMWVLVIALQLVFWGKEPIKNKQIPWLSHLLISMVYIVSNMPNFQIPVWYQVAHTIPENLSVDKFISSQELVQVNSNTPLILFLGGCLSHTLVHLLTQAYLYAFTKLTPMK